VSTNEITDEQVDAMLEAFYRTFQGGLAPIDERRRQEDRDWMRRQPEQFARRIPPSGDRTG
jgi:hypothetical protein